VKVGIVTPVLTLVPGAHGRWERDAGIDEVEVVARAADRLGFDHLTCAEHVAVPAAMEPQRGATYWDPSTTLGYLAACTERIRLATSVVVLGYHHPLELAKRYGTLDVVSRGRLVLGVGVGSLAEEFELLGAPFDDRGVRADDALRALRGSLSQRQPAAFPGWVVEPHATQAHVPIWVGGRTIRSLRRAVELADGWMPFGLDPPALAGALARVEIPEGFDTVFAPPRAVDPGGDPDRTLELVASVVGAGATIASVRIVGRSAEHYVEQLEALAELVISEGGPAPGGR
jgi:probable F420-dependent oxidoreductase